MKQKDLLETALSSLDGMRPASPGPDVLAGIKRGLSPDFRGANVRKLSLAQVRLAAAGLALLLAANVLLVTQWNSSQDTGQEAYAITSLVDDYNLYSNE